MLKNNDSKLKINFTGSRFVPDDSAKGLFLFLVFQTMVTLIYQVLYMVGLTQEIWSYMFTFILQACFVLCVYFVAKPRNINMVANLRLKRAPSIKQILLCVAISIVCLFGFSAITNIFLEVLYRMGYSSVTSEIVIPNFASYLFYILVICIAPAVCEEILFRGLICNGLKKMGNVVAVVGSAFIFMIMHGSPDQTVHQFILGIILALAFLVTNNLWVPIVIHFVNNFIAITITYAFYGDSSSTATESAELYLRDYLIYAILSAIVAGVIIYVLLKLLSKAGKPIKEVEPVEKRTVENSSVYGKDLDIDYARDYGTAEEIKEEALTSVDVVTMVDNPYENKLSGAGKVMYVLSIVWLVVDWISALALGFIQVV